MTLSEEVAVASGRVLKQMGCQLDAKRESHRLILIGNPNVGKSVVFHCLTGRYVTVSNFPGTTVEVCRGRANLDNGAWEVLDTPGVNSIDPLSEEERVTRELLLSEDGSDVLQIIDAKNLQRGLFLTLQMSELGLPMVLALNMADEASSRGINVDAKKLRQILGVNVVPTVAVKNEGIDTLKKAIPQAKVGVAELSYPDEIERAVEEVLPLLADGRVGSRGGALMLIGNENMGRDLNQRISPEAVERICKVRDRLEGELREKPGVIIARTRLKEAGRISARVLERQEKESRTWLARLGDLSMHPLWGIPILFAVLYVLYLFVGKFGAQTGVDFLEGTLFGRYLNPLMVRLTDILLPFPHIHQAENGVLTAAYTLTGSALPPARILHDLLIGEYGLVTMALTYAIAIILPIVVTFFFAFGLLEDSGYLPRLAVMTDRIFRLMGLNGKAILPMVLGLGCDTMATLTARTLETRKERLLVTLLLALGIPCSAQLGVILGILGSLTFTATLVWCGVVLLSLLGVGFLASCLLPGEQGDFLIELPPMRMPQLSNIVVKTLARVEWYLREAVPLFMLGTVILFGLVELGLLGLLEKAAEPVVGGVLGLPPQATEAFLIGFLRRDYGAAGLFRLYASGSLTPVQALVSLITITLFVPCIANFLVIVKEQGTKVALAMAGFIFPFAFAVGGAARLLLELARG